MASPEMEHRVSQLRHDVDDVYELLDATNQTVSTLATTQQQHGIWLTEIRQRIDHVENVVDRVENVIDRVEGAQREQGSKLDTILALLGGDRPHEQPDSL